jgi:adenylate kinase family enzyme
MRRVMVIGSPGAGKSTLAMSIAKRLDLPLIHLDREFWRPAWQETPRDEWRAKVAAMAAAPAWVIDGDYPGSFDLRAARADTVVWLDLPRRVCMAHVLLRIAVSFGRTRADMAPGCAERIDFAFLNYVWSYPREGRPRVQALLQQLSPYQRAITLRSSAEVRRFEKSLSTESKAA